MDFSRQVNQNDYTEKMPLYPTQTLVMHVAVKGLEAGSVIGLAITPIIALTRRLPLSTAWSRAMTLSPIMGSTVTLLLLAGKAYGTDTLDVHGVDDRAYRIKKNELNKGWDKFAVLGSLAGLSFSTVILSGSRVVSWSSTGLALGSISYFASKYIESKKASSV